LSSASCLAQSRPYAIRFAAYVPLLGLRKHHSGPVPIHSATVATIGIVALGL